MDAVLFVSPKVKFEKPDGSVGRSPGCGTALMGVGIKAIQAMQRARGLGWLVIQAPGYG